MAHFIFTGLFAPPEHRIDFSRGSRSLVLSRLRSSISESIRVHSIARIRKQLHVCIGTSRPLSANDRIVSWTMFRATRDHSCSARIERDSYLDFDSRATALKIPPERDTFTVSHDTYRPSFLGPRHVSFVNCTYRRFAEQRET